MCFHSVSYIISTWIEHEYHNSSLLVSQSDENLTVVIAFKSLIYNIMNTFYLLTLLLPPNICIIRKYSALRGNELNILFSSHTPTALLCNKSLINVLWAWSYHIVIIRMGTKMGTQRPQLLPRVYSNKI